MLSGPALALAALATCAPPARPILSEVFYDAAGDDTGLEFVELLNPTAAARSLAGLRLEAGDGSAPGRWSLRWTGGPADSVPAGGRFVIGGARVSPPPQALASLDLQNGPDAVRLVWPDGEREVLGYGAHEHAEYACGEPAADPPSGLALARIPDDSDLGANARDFVPAAPSPGRANQARLDAGWVAGAIVAIPEQPAAGARIALTGRAANLGRMAIAAGALRVAAVARGGGVERVLLERPAGPELAPGETLRIDLDLDPLPEGRIELIAVLALDGDEAPGNDRDSLRLRVGPGPLEITEVQFHPARGEGEWVEVRNRSPDRLPASAIVLSDRGATRGRARGAPPPLEPESLAVLAQDRAALVRIFPKLDSLRVWLVAPWPALNNADDASGLADAVALRDSDGVASARLDYSAAGIPAGATLERARDGSWGPSAEPHGSPLQPPRETAPVAGAFQVAPRRLARAARAARLAWELPWRARVAAELYSLSGARVAVALPETAAPARGEREWRAESLEAGTYLLVFRARPESGGEELRVTRVLRLD